MDVELVGVGQHRLSRWAIVIAGGLLSVAGGIWWAWDANPARGRAVLLAGLVVVVAGLLLTRRSKALPDEIVLALAVLVCLYAGYQAWQAISTIIEQGAAHLA